MDLVEALSSLELNDALHEARLLVLLLAFAGADGQGEIEGLTKLAKLDFLLRYPALLERALVARRANPKGAAVEMHERDSVESRMVRYRFGPWDHRYRKFLNQLVARGLTTTRVEGRKITIGLTDEGRRVAAQIAEAQSFAAIVARAKVLKSHLDLTASNLMRFVYETFPELTSLRMNEQIPT